MCPTQGFLSFFANETEERLVDIEESVTGRVAALQEAQRYYGSAIDVVVATKREKSRGG